MKFKSLCPSVICQDDINKMIGEALSHQYSFVKRTPPSETDEWDESDLKSFEVDPEFVDRVYVIQALEDGISDKLFELVARQIYNGRALYLTFIASCSYEGSYTYAAGEIYVTFDAQIFFNSMLELCHGPDGIWSSMADDGCQIENSFYFYCHPPRFWRTTPRLMFLCLDKFYDEWSKLREQATAPGSLPEILLKTIDDHMRIRETRRHYDDGFTLALR
uniref:Uncharacterized protein n=1 Tax=Trachysalambria curvirostris nimavirus TaxID=2984282 RepID=A0A9C7F8D4_9VIRU|nr:MAG: hypothetical protein [Trachysalambria curvirostris nimavirus]